MKYNWKNVEGFEETYNKVLKQISLINNGVDEEDKVKYHILTKKFMEYFEEYFYNALILGYVTSSNLKAVLYRLSKIKDIRFFISYFTNQDSYTSDDKTIICLSRDLSDDEIKFLVFKELALISTSINRKVGYKSINYIDSKNPDKDLCINYKEINNGLKLIEEGITIDMAENIFFKSVNEKRPDREKHRDYENFGFIRFLTNYRINSCFQDLTIILARSCDANSENKSDEKVLFDFSREALKNNFTMELIVKLIKLYGLDNMCEALNNLGLVYRKKTDNVENPIFFKKPVKVRTAKKAFRNAINIMYDQKVR